MKSVNIQFRGGRAFVHPDPIVIKLNEEITWNISSHEQEATIYSGGQIQRILILGLVINVYFSIGDSPFASEDQVIKADLVNGSIEAHQTSGPALRRGQFKYGVRIRESYTNQLLEDEDPMIIVA